MAEEASAAGMEIDTATPAPAPNAETPAEDRPKPRFEIKKYNAVALWAWGTISFIALRSVIVEVFRKRLC